MNMFDSDMVITIADVTKGVPPKVLDYVSQTGQPRQEFAPDLKNYKGTPVYKIPRRYGERLLTNCGGRTYILVSPNEFMIRKEGKFGATYWETLKASKQNPDGSWSQLTAEEIAKAGTPEIDKSLQEALTKKPEEAAPVVAPRSRRK